MKKSCFAPTGKAMSKIDKGVLYMLVASFFGAVMSGFAKILSEDMDTLEVVFFRNIIGVVILMFSFSKIPLKQTGGRPFLLIFRGFIGFIALLLWFYNVKYIPLADAVTFSNTAPIFTAIFACMFLGERIGSVGWFAIFLGFLGLVFIVKPSGLSLKYTDILGISSGLASGLAYTSIRELKKIYDTRVIVLSFMGAGVVGPIILSLVPESMQIENLRFLFGNFKMPSGMEWAYIAGMGIFSTLMQFIMTLAYGASKAGIVSAVSYSNIIFSTFIGVMMGDAFPDFLGWFGIALIIFSGILIAKER